jgi:hypothetical protein
MVQLGLLGSGVSHKAVIEALARAAVIQSMTRKVPNSIVTRVIANRTQFLTGC